MHQYAYLTLILLFRMIVYAYNIISKAYKLFISTILPNYCEILSIIVFWYIGPNWPIFMDYGDNRTFKYHYKSF